MSDPTQQIGGGDQPDPQKPPKPQSEQQTDTESEGCGEQDEQ